MGNDICGHQTIALLVLAPTQCRNYSTNFVVDQAWREPIERTINNIVDSGGRSCSLCGGAIFTRL